ncbi:MAG: hypothetical protein NT027_07940 [Proteobacteria bacterium]|nr:hypothetical protein [Pseudomonadota bacterium]
MKANGVSSKLIQMSLKQLCFCLALSILQASCSKSDKKDEASGKSYSFDAVAKATLKMKSTSLADSDLGAVGSEATALAGPTLCSSVVCFTPSALTGKYYGSGFSIQSNGNGMVAYFGQDAWSNIKGTSSTYSFDSSVPTTNSGTLTCCGGTGDLTSENTYIESVIYLFAYLDATFTVSGVTSNTLMNREFTVRFVFADDAITGGKRGDVLMKDPADSIFKWIDTATSAGGNVGNGTLTTTRPTAPVTMNASVKNWVNPFGSDKGNQSIPVLYAPITPSSGTGVFQVNETQLKTVGRTYNYSFDPSNFIMFPSLQKTDLNSIYSYVQLLSNIHLGGLPHSGQSMGVGNPASTVLTVTEP